MFRQIVSIIGLCLVNVYVGLAQTDYVAPHSIRYRLGVTGGLNVGQVATPDAKNTSDLLWRYNGGLCLEQRFSPTIALIYQLQYVRQGSNTLTNTIGGPPISKTEYIYATLPVLLRYQPRAQRGFVEIGGQVGYFLDGTIYFVYMPNKALSHQYVANLDAGLTGGVGYNLGKHLVLDGRYYYSLRKINPDFVSTDPTTGQTNTIHTVPQFHRVWSLNLSYYF